jgi:hypothetical protein
MEYVKLSIKNLTFNNIFNLIFLLEENKLILNNYKNLFIKIKLLKNYMTKN